MVPIINLYFNGSLEGIPAFLGNLAGVFLILLKIITFLEISESGKTNSSTFSSFPPRTFIAFFPDVISSSTLLPFMHKHFPPILAIGIKYSDKTVRFATALAVT